MLIIAFPFGQVKVFRSLDYLLLKTPEIFVMLEPIKNMPKEEHILILHKNITIFILNIFNPTLFPKISVYIDILQLILDSGILYFWLYQKQWLIFSWGYN